MRDLDRFRGCLIGGAAGDALGYAVEFDSENNIFSKYGDRGITSYNLRNGVAEVSDDTQMTLFTAAGLLYGTTRGMTRGIAGPYNGYIYKSYIDWLQTQEKHFPLKGSCHVSWLVNVQELFSRRAPGNTCLSALRSGSRGTPEKPINTSKGCGGIMRVAPIGLYFNDKGKSIKEIDQLGAEAAALTHGHSLGWLPAAALVHIIHEVSQNDESILEAVLHALNTVDELWAGDKHVKDFTDLIEKAIDLASDNIDDLKAIHNLGEGWVGDEALAIAVYCSLKYSNDFDRAIIASVNHKGDSDSTGAVTGNILGAKLGLSGIPIKYIDTLELKEVILEIADDLYNDCQMDEHSVDPEWSAKYITTDYILNKEFKHNRKDETVHSGVAKCPEKSKNAHGKAVLNEGNKSTGTITIQKTNITELDTDAIVNAANDGLWAGTGVCGAIFEAAGYEQLQAACNKIGHCDVGSAVITPGFNLKAKYIIHAVGPTWSDGYHNEPKLLYGAYFRSLKLAVENGCRSIGFPLISAGVFGYPLEDAWRKAIQACRDFLKKRNNINIVFAVLDDNILNIGKGILKDTASEFSPVVRADWQTTDMPAQHDTFILNLQFSSEQMSILKKGHIPKAMEDKWFWYMEGNTLFAHRSWTGICIYRIDFSPDNHHKVTVNRDPKQYNCTDINDDKNELIQLLKWWLDQPYDHYSEWLSETMIILKKAGQIRDKLRVGDKDVDAVFFHLPTETHGYLSNWFTSPFSLDGIHYTSVEQYIMYQKCVISGDMDTAKAILATDDTRKQQSLGRMAKGYNKNVWAGMRQVVAIRGLLAKFSQNIDLKERLLATGDAWLVECAHTDTIWACGIRLNENERFDTAKWSGQNILGFALMEVRSMLRGAE